MRVTVEIAETCPRCGVAQDAPRLERQYEDGEFFSVSRWENECGDLDLYPDVLAKARRP